MLIFSIFLFVTLVVIFSQNQYQDDIPPLDVKKNSVKLLGDKIYFINGDKLCSFKKGVVKEIKTMANFKGAEVLCCGAMGTKYLIEYTFNGEEDKRVSVIDVEREGESTFIGQILSVSNKGLFLFDGQVYRMNETGNLKGDFSWESKPLDFNKPEQKTLSSISLRVKGEVDLVVTTDFGEKIYKFKDGYFTKKTNLRSKTFKIKVLSNGECSIDALSVSYY